MKIKTKKQLNLPQLIDYAWENPDLSNGMSILSNDWENVRINFKFNPRGVLSLDILNGRNISDDIPFTLKVEEEIDEDTVFKKLICLDVDDKYNIYDNVCVLDFDEDRVRAIYIPNDDLTLTLIWTHEKGLVE